jgi:microcystin-dependent protein
MAEPFLGEIRIASFGYAPKGWALANGQLLPINQNQALFSLLGTMYGGNGTTNFALPNLQGRSPVHRGNEVTQGQFGGAFTHTLTLQELPGHTHPMQAATATAAATSPTNNTFGTVSSTPPYSSESPQTSLGAATVTATGGSQPHDNVQPYLVLNFLIALQGIYPSRN